MVNRDQLVELLAQRAGLEASEVEAVRSGDVSRVLQTRLGANPAVRTMLEAMAANRARDAATEAPQEPVGEPEPLHDALRAAHDAVTYLAAMLGACGCWGNDPSCDRCLGRGRPGFRPPHDPKTFLSWVSPALAHLGMRVERIHVEAGISNAEQGG